MATRAVLLSAVALVAACDGERVPKDPLTLEELTGTLFYLSENRCGDLGLITETGMLINPSMFLERKPCGAYSAIECDDGVCRLACERFNNSDTTALFEIKRFNDELPEWVSGEVFWVTPAVRRAASKEGLDQLFENHTAFPLFTSQIDCEYERAARRAATDKQDSQ